MTLREPLVIIAGQVQQLPSGDTINGTETGLTGTFQATNNSGGTVNKCMAAYVKGDDLFGLASANSSTLSVFAGLVYEDTVNAGDLANIQYTGPLTATTAQWDAVTGETGGLVAGTVYYLSPTTSGNITLNVPDTVGQYIQPVGIALNTTDLNIFQRASVLL